MVDENRDKSDSPKKRKLPNWLDPLSKHSSEKRKRESIASDNNELHQDKIERLNSTKGIKVRSISVINEEGRTLDFFSDLSKNNAQASTSASNEIPCNLDIDANKSTDHTFSNNLSKELHQIFSIAPNDEIIVKNEVEDSFESVEVKKGTEEKLEPAKATEVGVTLNTETIEIKEEKLTYNDEADSTNSVQKDELGTSGQVKNQTVSSIKVEPTDNKEEGTSGSTENKDKKDNTIPVAAVSPLVVNNEPKANSSVRPSCKFGIKCYRQNPVHRTEEAHPGDTDYRRPEYSEPPKGTPFCPYGDLCYRRNPAHFQQFAHPPSTDPVQNRLDRKNNLRDKKPVVYMAVYPDENSSSDDDFSAGSDNDFDPINMQESDSSADEGVDLKDGTQNISDESDN